MPTEQILLNEEIRRVKRKIKYWNNREHELKNTKEYNLEHREEVRERKRVYDAIQGALNMKGLCHICFCSNIEIYNHKNQIICHSCLEDQKKDD